MASLRTAEKFHAQRLCRFAPAKVNLTLEILARRADGYHELETLMLGVSVCDTLTMTATESPELVVDCRWATGLQAERNAGEHKSLAASVWEPLPEIHDNLVWKALHRLRTSAGVSQGARVTLHKRIPAQAGLGGASADAAAALLTANDIWQLNWSLPQLAELAAELGSDVPFFLCSGMAICRGRGERIEPVRSARCVLVIVRPPVGLSTPAVYKQCRAGPNTHSANQVQSALVRGDLAAAATEMRNGLQPAAASISPWIGKLQAAFARSGAVGHQMSGSGSSYFGLFWHQGQARRSVRRLRGQNLGTTMLATSIQPTGCAP